MCCTWVSHRLPWASIGSTVGCLWGSRCRPWVAHGSLTDFHGSLAVSHGTLVGFRGSLMPPHASHGLPMGRLWVACGSPVDTCWANGLP